MKEQTVNGFRDGLSVVREGYVYLNHASVAPLHDDVVSAFQEGIETQRLRGSLAQWEWFEKMGEARAECARLIGANPESIALMPNTSSGIMRALSSIKFTSGEEVVYLVDEFPTLYWPLAGLSNKGVKLIPVKAKLGQDLTEAVISAINVRTRLVAISWVNFFSGARVDLAKISDEKRRRGFYFLVDAMQGLGCIPLNISELAVDFLAEHGAKWLMAPVGMGFLYASSEALRLEPDLHGWYSHEIDWDGFLRRDTALHPDARRFETGSPAMSNLYAFTSAVRKLNEIGAEFIWKRVCGLTSQLISSLRSLPVEIITPVEEDRGSGIVTFKCAGAKELFQKLEKNKIIVSYREGAIRVSPHFWNTRDELGRLLGFLQFL